MITLLYLLTCVIAFVVCLAVGLLPYLILIGISWLGVCGLVYLFTLIFNLTFSWAVATFVWIVIILLYELFK